MSQYLEQLATVLRTAGLTVVEMVGWQTRGRSGNSQYADGRPWCVMVHHTASAGDGLQDADYCTYGHPDAPICNLVIGRDAVVYVCAAGPTNTNGKGNPLTFSRGTVPTDSMNYYAVGIELSSNGTGMTYPAGQIDAMFTSILAITGAYGMAPDDVSEHHTYAPTRKIDPATAAAVQGNWRPEATTSSGTWWVNDLQAECRVRAAPITPPPLPPLPEEIEMLYIAVPKYPGATDASEWWAIFESGAVRRAVNSDVTYAGRSGIPTIDQDSKEHDDYLRSIAVRPW